MTRFRGASLLYPPPAPSVPYPSASLPYPSASVLYPFPRHLFTPPSLFLFRQPIAPPTPSRHHAREGTNTAAAIIIVPAAVTAIINMWNVGVLLEVVFGWQGRAGPGFRAGFGVGTMVRERWGEGRG